MLHTYKTILFSVVTLLICAYHPAFAQEEDQTESKAEIFTAKNSVHLDLAWSQVGYSINYGRIIYQKDKLKIAATAGFSLYYRSESEPIHSGYAVPFFLTEIVGFIGKSKHHLEFGTGFYAYREIRYFVDDSFQNNIGNDPYWGTSIMPRIGYRHQKPKGGFFWRAAYTPRIDFVGEEVNPDNVNFFPFGLSVSLGLSF